MSKRKFKLRYLYEGGASMEDFYEVPVAGIMLENGSRISICYGSTANAPSTSQEDAEKQARERGMVLIEPRDFSLIRFRQKEIRKMIDECGAKLVLADECVWVQDTESGQVSAYSLADGRQYPQKDTAGVVLKFK